MGITVIDPLKDDRWQEFVALHPNGSVFHTRNWLLALRSTYGYEPFAIAECSPTNGLQSAILFCVVDSWITGRRLVSVPFADHCDPLVANSAELKSLLSTIEGTCGREQYKYVELRPLNPKFSEPCSKNGFIKSSSYGYHSVDLTPEIDDLFAKLHASCIRRKIRRAEIEGLEYRTGTDEETVRHFYRLLLATRRRHGMVTQPFDWFIKLTQSFADKLTVHLAVYRGKPIAGIMTIRHAKTLVYKYGASDESCHHLGGMPFLFWKAIVYGKLLRLKELDLGRTDISNAGLTEFKGRLGGRFQNLAYYRSPLMAVNNMSRCGTTFMRLCAQLPDALYCAAGDILYKHSA